MLEASLAALDSFSACLTISRSLEVSSLVILVVFSDATNASCNFLFSRMSEAFSSYALFIQPMNPISFAVHEETDSSVSIRKRSDLSFCNASSRLSFLISSCKRATCSPEAFCDCSSLFRCFTSSFDSSKSILVCSICCV
ncbi:hypothetical protein HanRHA438_Chr07g0301321 [Helianthus annuus]|nr:hypothetical protein HanIR_Chr07g0313691 [Helianthus annuus]KAJ0907630.1 hypothetical protein HanRHA438_Chr07g0301321 [Helianthus annuus]